MRVMHPDLASGRTGAPYAGMGPRIFTPLKILYAACRHQPSILFLASVVNLALLAPSCRWLIMRHIVFNGPV